MTSTLPSPRRLATPIYLGLFSLLTITTQAQQPSVHKPDANGQADSPPARSAPSGVQATKVSGSGNLSLSPTSANFGNEAVGGTSASKMFTLANTSEITVTVTSVGISGSYTGFANCPESLTSGESCTITLSFRPTTVGTHTGKLTVTDSAANSPQTATLSGSGTN